MKKLHDYGHWHQGNEVQDETSESLCLMGHFQICFPPPLLVEIL
jgi:hypothetical protein